MYNLLWSLILILSLWLRVCFVSHFTWMISTLEIQMSSYLGHKKSAKWCTLMSFRCLALSNTHNADLLFNNSMLSWSLQVFDFFQDRISRQYPLNTKPWEISQGHKSQKVMIVYWCTQYICFTLRHTRVLMRSDSNKMFKPGYMFISLLVEWSMNLIMRERERYEGKEFLVTPNNFTVSLWNIFWCVKLTFEVNDKNMIYSNKIPNEIPLYWFRFKLWDLCWNLGGKSPLLVMICIQPIIPNVWFIGYRINSGILVFLFFLHIVNLKS